MEHTSTCVAVSTHKIPEDRIQTHIYYQTYDDNHLWMCVILPLRMPPKPHSV